MESKLENETNVSTTKSDRGALPDSMIDFKDATNQDALDMRRLGNTQELKVRALCIHKIIDTIDILFDAGKG